MGKRFATVLLSLMFYCLIFVVEGQESTTRNYAISEIHYTFTGDERFTITVHVQNNGADATATSEVIVTLISDANRELMRDTLEPLLSNQTIILEIPFRSADFPAGTEQIIQVAVGIDQFELANTEIASDNISSIIVPIPNTNFFSSLSSIVKLSDNGIVFLGEEYTQWQAALGIGAGVATLILLWILTVILRLLFRRPARFKTWHPPYGVMPVYDPHSVEGRRWTWQQYAQNNLLLAPPIEGHIHPIKLLLGMDGENLQHWKVIGLRLNHYDTYGRISRTQAVADKSKIKRLNNIIQKRDRYDEEKLQKMIRPIADSLSKSFIKKTNKKSAFLPVAFDIRWEGNHGEIRIFFELYQFKNHIWYRIDLWEPMMQVLSHSLQENFTFTMHGKATNEKMRDFRERLRDDLIWLMLEMIRVEQASSQSDSQPVERQQYDIPDTLSDIQPIPTDKMPATSPTNG